MISQWVDCEMLRVMKLLDERTEFFCESEGEQIVGENDIDFFEDECG